MDASTNTASLRFTSGPSVSLKPKEHGAYAILGIPIATALVIAEPTVAGFCIAIAAFAGFFAYEPLLVAWGHRGLRAKRTTPVARQRSAILIAIAAFCGSLAWLISFPEVRIALAVCLLLATISFVVGTLGKHRVQAAQVWGIVSLSAPCIPILLAGSQSLGRSFEVGSVWLIGFASTTTAVRGVIAAQKRRRRTVHWISIAALSVLAVALGVWGIELAITSLPMILMSWYLVLRPPPARQLKRVGWSLVIATIATAVWMIVRIG